MLHRSGAFRDVTGVADAGWAKPLAAARGCYGYREHNADVDETSAFHLAPAGLGSVVLVSLILSATERG
jgi:hypothetical protein